MRIVVEKAIVTGPFLSSDASWGVAVAGGWSHLAGKRSTVYADRLKTAAQAMAEKREDYHMLRRALAEFTAPVAQQAVRILEADALDRSEKTLGVAKWFAELHEQVSHGPRYRTDNFVWKAVAAAPPGFCHIRSSMIGTLLVDIVTGYSFDVVAKRWADKMHPLKYQRPTAAPAAGTIRQAEQVVAKLGIEASLKRRHARLTDVLDKLWVPPTELRKAPAAGVFGHLRPEAKTNAGLSLPPKAITWEKFRNTVLPGATGIEVNVPGSSKSFYGLLTAADPDGPPILQWDGLEGEARNPVSWYFYNDTSSAWQWNLTSGWNAVTAVFYSPPFWQVPQKFKHHATQVFFAIKGCSDNRRAPLCLFPEILKSELHSVRSVIEAHSKSVTITPDATADATGLSFSNGSPLTVRVQTAAGKATYTIDRVD
jgi:hypothetical protein